jgi:ankyrin repeat protein
LLLANGGNPATLARDQTTPLLVAAGLAHQDNESRIPEASHLAAVKMLVNELGANIDSVNAAGFSPLHASAYAGFDSVADFLAQKGAELNQKTKGGQTPLGIAEGNNLSGFFFEKPTTAAVLRKYGAMSVGAVSLQSFMENKARRDVAPDGQDGGDQKANDTKKDVPKH